MTAREFTYWLKGYLKGLGPNAEISKVIFDITTELDKVDKPDLEKADKTAEKLTEDWLKELQRNNPPQQKPYPFPFQENPVVMYGCPSTYPPNITYNNTNPTTDTTNTENK